jgi:hypothetical protein
MESAASLGAVARGEQMQAQRFSQLGQAAQMKKRAEDELFDINVMTPYQRKLQLEQMKGAAEGERYNAGMQMVGQGLSNAASAGLQYTYSNPGQNPFSGLFKGKIKTPPSPKTSLSSDILGAPGFQQKTSSSLKRLFETKNKNLFNNG